MRLILLNTFPCGSKHNKQDTAEIQARPSDPSSDPTNNALTANEELHAANKWQLAKYGISVGIQAPLDFVRPRKLGMPWHVTYNVLRMTCRTTMEEAASHSALLHEAAIGGCVGRAPPTFACRRFWRSVLLAENCESPSFR